MSVDWTTLERKIRELPPDLQREVEAFVNRLAGTRTEAVRLAPTFRWAGALKGEKKTSVELQHEIARQWNADT